MGPRLHFAEGPQRSYSAVGYFCEMKSVSLATLSPLLTVKNGYTVLKLTLIDVCESSQKFTLPKLLLLNYYDDIADILYWHT